MHNDLIKDIITILQRLDRGQLISTLPYLSDQSIREVMDNTEDENLKDLTTIEWYNRRVMKLEEVSQKYYSDWMELERKLLQKNNEVEQLKLQIRNMETEAKMLSDPEFFMPTEKELIMARDVGKIPAIKAYRSRTDAGLRISKDNIERAMELRGWAFKSYPLLVENK